MQRLPIDQDALETICRRHGIRRLSLFGSLLKDCQSPSSDIDLLVEFEAGMAPGLLGLASIAAELEALIGRTVDLRTPQDLSPYFRDEVTLSAEVQFAA